MHRRSKRSISKKETIMRREVRLVFWLATALLAFFAAGAVAIAGDKEVDDGVDLYFREVSLTALSDQALEEYVSSETGESELFDRAFPDAPPQIPHTLEDMLPITLNSNECIDCHHPDNVASKEDLPLPKSHFSRAVMGAGSKGEAQAWMVKGYEETKEIGGNRYNCSMCHTPQASNVDTPGSTFVRVERKE
jgi:cytochrome c-type protein NapB